MHTILLNTFLNRSIRFIDTADLQQSGPGSNGDEEVTKSLASYPGQSFLKGGVLEEDFSWWTDVLKTKTKLPKSKKLFTLHDVTRLIFMWS